MSTTNTYLVNGMTCGHCVMSVTEELTALDGVREVAVDLRPGGASTVTVESETPLDEGVIRTAVTEAGYALADTRP